MWRFILMASLVPLLAGADWPQHLGMKRDSTSSETGLVRSFPKDGPTIAWKHPVGRGWAAPVVANGKLVIFHRLDTDEIVECLDAATGKGIWKANYRSRYRDDFEFDDGPRSTPLIEENRVYTLGANGQLTAWELKDGKQIWSLNINDRYDVPKAFFGVGTSPMIVAGKLLINVGGKKAGVVAFDPATGKELWKSSDHGVSYSSPVASTIAGQELAVFFTRVGLLALSPTDGKIVYEQGWRPRINASVNAATPIVQGDRIFITTSYSTGAILLEGTKSGLKEIWNNDESLSCHFNTPVYHDQHLYGIDGRQESRAALRCIDFATGKVKWTEAAFGCSGLINVDGMLIATPENGDLVLIDRNATMYKELARAKFQESPVRALPAISNGILYTRDGQTLRAVNLKK